MMKFQAVLATNLQLKFIAAQRNLKLFDDCSLRLDKICYNRHQ